MTVGLVIWPFDSITLPPPGSGSKVKVAAGQRSRSQKESERVQQLLRWATAAEKQTTSGNCK